MIENSPDIKISKINEVYYSFQCENEGIYGELYNYFKVKVPNYLFNPLYKAHLWDGSISFFNIRERLFPQGLFKQFQEFCIEYSYKYSFNFKKESFPNISDEELESFYKELYKDYEKYYPRDYQKEQVKLFLENKKGIIISSTGSGKTNTLYIIIRYLLQSNKKILLVVPNVSLVNQSYSDWADYGWKEIDKYTTKFYAGQTPDFRKKVIISTYQSISKKPKEFFEQFDVVINDETHMSKSISLKYINENSKNACWKLGVTGTLPQDNLCNFYNTIGFIGPILSELKSKTLQDQNFLVQCNIRSIILKYPTEFIKKYKSLDFQTEKKTVYQYSPRNKILNFIYSKIPDGQNSLILVNEIEHLESIKKHLEETFPDKYKLLIIHGKIKPEVRESIRNLMKIEKNIILLASYGSFAVGSNVPSIENIVLFSSSKSEIRLLQSIGRSLRLMEGKTRATIFDIVDDLRYNTRNGNTVENYLYRHWRGYYNDFENKKIMGRMDYYTQEGFDVKILEKKLGDI